MKWTAIALLLLLGLAAVAVPARADAEDDDDDAYDDTLDEEEVVAKAFLMVRRKLSDDKPQVGKPITVLVELHNAGDSPATGVNAKEESWDGEAFSTSGELEASFDTIPAGTTYSFSYSITPKFAVELYEHRPTLVTYTAEEGGGALATTSPWLPFRAFTTTDLLKLKALHYGSVVTLGGLNTPTDWTRFALVAGVLAAGYAGWNAYSTVTETRKKSVRRSALRDLGVTEDELKRQ